MEVITNDRIPHIGELIFKHFSDQELLQLRLLSKFHQELALTVLIRRWKNRFKNDCYVGPEHVPIPLLRFLLNQPYVKSMEINAKDTKGHTTFMKACINGNLTKVKVMLELLESLEQNWIDPNITDNDGKTAFMWACFVGHNEIVRILMDHSRSKNIDLNMKDRHGLTGLELACQNRHNVNLVKIILNRIEAKHIDLEFPISVNYSPQIVILLLKAKTMQMLSHPRLLWYGELIVSPFEMTCSLIMPRINFQGYPGNPEAAVHAYFQEMDFPVVNRALQARLAEKPISIFPQDPEDIQAFQVAAKAAAEAQIHICPNLDPEFQAEQEAGGVKFTIVFLNQQSEFGVFLFQHPCNISVENINKELDN